ncbi:hypothetical protein H7F51_01260 [Novosphingobium flavum]|uniref:Uncharacterized protein n=1 Tax=Novosphingobium flavum TaxID=1778672 RepID=A0A7X1KK42_9SPHN|nr:hypothetical protein [Novosphingobium flavum]MBC2664139.1 hypothetical protein [Novosphingobium flavum]
MDLNELLYQHQRALMTASLVPIALAGSRFDLVGHYAERIRRLRSELGVSVWPGPALR